MSERLEMTEENKDGPFLSAAVRRIGSAYEKNSSGETGIKIRFSIKTILVITNVSTVKKQLSVGIYLLKGVILVSLLLL